MDDVSAQQIEAATNGKYRVEGLIGRGGMGAVYLAVHRELGSRVAIKVLPPDVRGRSDRLARFRREGAVAANLSHPNLVPVFELNSATELTYLVMPYIDGEALDHYLAREGTMSWEETLDLVTSTGSALSHAHERGVIHRDIKPGNLLRERATGRWLVTDFGVAHVVTPVETEITLSEATIGTFAYMAPEQLGGARTVDGRADLYALATVAYEALTGELPEREGAERTRRRLATRRPDLPPDVVRALTTALAEARDERPATVAGWVGSLVPRRWSRMARRVAAVVLPILAVATFAIIATRRSPVPTAPPTIAVLPFQLQTSGVDPGVLDSILPQLVVWGIRTLTTFRVIEDTRVRAEIRQRFGNQTPGLDSLVALMAGRLDADQVVIGRATRSGDSLTLRIEVLDARRGTRIDVGQHSGPASDAAGTVTQVVIDAFATRVAEELLGTTAPSIPSNLPAIEAYFKGVRAFGRGALDEALQRFNETIAHDSAFAPAYLKRILATGFAARPTVAITNVRTAVEQAAEYRQDLDPVSQRLLEAFEAVAIRGDLREADRLTSAIVDEYPDAIDAWFLMGALRTIFPALTDATPQEARGALRQVLERDPTFVAASGLMIQIALAEDRPDDARGPIRDFLAVDSTSTNAQLVRLTDTLLRFPSRVGDIANSFPDRPTVVLENLALVTAEFWPPTAGRAIGAAAIGALRSTAATQAERTLAFRLRMATHIGSGEFDAAGTLLRSAATVGVSGAEIDRWQVLGWATPAPPLVSAEEGAAAAARLSTHADDPLLNTWLAARWAVKTGRPTDAAIRDFQSALGAPERDEILSRSLQLDLEALQALADGDTARAIARWMDGISRVSIGRVFFGLGGSLWALRADLVLTASEAGQDSVAMQVAAQFDRRFGILDQVVWEPVMLARARSALRRGDLRTARTTYDQLLRIWGHGASHPRRDSVEALRDAIVNP